MAGFLSEPTVMRNVFSKFSLVLNGFEKNEFLHFEVKHFLHSVDYHIPGTIQETFQVSALMLYPFEIFEVEERVRSPSCSEVSADSSQYEEPKARADRQALSQSSTICVMLRPSSPVAIFCNSAMTPLQGHEVRRNVTQLFICYTFIRSLLRPLECGIIGPGRRACLRQCLCYSRRCSSTLGSVMGLASEGI
jgi:hypothetical protein